MRDSPSPRKIVLTGGTGAGKTVAAREIATRLADQLLFVPEAATQVYELLGRRWNVLSLQERRDAQTAMYQLQLEQERRYSRQAGIMGKSLLLDRGTLDGAGYWPDGPAEFFTAHNTTWQAERDRYHAVLWLETAAAVGLYDHDLSNPVRFENAPEAIASGQRMDAMWTGELIALSPPRNDLIRVAARASFDDKLADIERIVRGLLQPPVA
jgi:predicted ATPase